jgi:hypothetical protein
MTPDTERTTLERAVEADTVAKIEFDKGDLCSAEKWALHAFHLRMQARDTVQRGTA